MTTDELHALIDEVARDLTSAPDARGWANPVHQMVDDTAEFLDPDKDWDLERDLEPLERAGDAWVFHRTDVTRKTRYEYGRRIREVIAALGRLETA